VLLAVALWCSPARADEQLGFVARWMGIEAGVATAVSVVKDGTRVVTVTAKNAGWLDGLYPIDDQVTSVSYVEGGSKQYVTRFREGRFLQDQDMQFGAGTVTVSRHQLIDGAWQDSRREYKAPSGVEDPVSALYRVRDFALQVGEQRAIQVFNGKRTLDVLATCDRAETAGDGAVTRHVTFRSAKDGDYDGALELYLSSADVPMLAIVQTKAGPVRIEVR